MNNLDTEFIDESLIENGGSKSDLSLSTSCLDIENHLSDPNTPTPIKAVVRISQPDSDFDGNVPKNMSLQKTLQSILTSRIHHQCKYLQKWWA